MDLLISLKEMREKQNIIFMELNTLKKNGKIEEDKEKDCHIIKINL